MLFGLAAVFLWQLVICGVCVKVPVATVICAVICVLTLAMAVYMFVCHEKFAFGKGNMMAGVHKHLVEHLEWDGNGQLLDIGCGAADHHKMCKGISEGKDHSNGLLGSTVELCQGAVREKCKAGGRFRPYHFPKGRSLRNWIMRMRHLMRQ